MPNRALQAKALKLEKQRAANRVYPIDRSPDRAAQRSEAIALCDGVAVKRIVALDLPKVTRTRKVRDFERPTFAGQYADHLSADPIVIRRKRR